MNDFRRILSKQGSYWLIEIKKEDSTSLFGNAIVLTRNSVDTMYFIENAGIISKKNIVEESLPSESEISFFEYCRVNKEFPLTKAILRDYNLLSYLKEDE